MKNNMNDEQVLKKRAIDSLTIKLMEQFLSLSLSVVISIVLARLLSPSEYGIIAIVNVFIVLSSVFVESGLGVALIQKKEIDDDDVGTTFISLLVLGIILYIAIFLVSPIVGRFYNMPVLCSVMRVYGITIILASISNFYNSFLSRKLEYKKSFYATLLATIISGAIGIWLAFNDFGVWALVFQYLMQKVTYLMAIVIMSKYKFRFCFKINSFKLLVGFSWKVFMARIITTLFNQIRNLIIGKQFQADILGNYNKGSQYPSTIGTAIDNTIQSVMFSVYSKKQDDLRALKSMVRRSMKVSAYIVMPVMLGLACVAKPVVSIVLTEKWLGTVPFLQIACFVYAIQPINSANHQAINALGKSNVSLILIIIKSFISVVLLIIAIYLKNVYVIAWSAVVATLFESILYMIVNTKILKYSVREQLSDLFSTILATFLMTVFVSALGLINTDISLVLLIQIIGGVIAYIFISWLFKIDSFSYCVELFKQIILKM